MRLTIAARKSDLARLQAQLVGDALLSHHPNLKIDYVYRSSLGDLQQDVPLTQVENKGVFTEDFYADLVNGQFDMVVHSWKDLPVEAREKTEICATLKRADVRDLIFIRKSALSDLKSRGLKVLSSSPRRAYNLKEFLGWAIPARLKQVEFVSVRGNVPTRIKKLLNGEGDALVVAKAAIDRLLEAKGDEYLDAQKVIHSALGDCRWMVLPLSVNPSAAAQGALAIEVAKGRPEVQKLLRSIHSQNDFSCVAEERRILASHGGGCHQKIGVNVLTLPFGKAIFLKGLTDAHVILDQVGVLQSEGTKAQSADFIFPRAPAENRWFERVPIADSECRPTLDSSRAWYVARANAMPASLTPENAPEYLWTAGIQSWRTLADRGFWVNGCTDSLGETQFRNVDVLTGSMEWRKLTHQLAAEGNDIITYKLHPLPPDQSADLTGRTHFFWMSSSSFLRARELFPHAIAAGNHSCGAGSTWNFLKGQIRTPVTPYLSYDEWRTAVLPC